MNEITLEFNDVMQRLVINGECYAEGQTLHARDVLDGLEEAGVITFRSTYVDDED